MNARIALTASLAGLILVAGGGATWWWLRTPLSQQSMPALDDADLPQPPVPPRIAEGEEYERCLAMLPDDPFGARVTAETWLMHGGSEAGMHCLALARLQLGDSEAGAEMLEALATNSHAPDVARAEVFDQADQAWLMAGNPGRAYADATLAVTLSPDNPDLLVDRAIAGAALGQWPQVEADLARALDLDPKRVDALVLRGSAWRHLGRIDLASADIDQALLNDPDNTEALLERGILRQRVNDQAGARQDWERAISLDPDSNTADLAQQDLALLDAGPERR